ncbi:DUF1642 domain-containing protein [Lacticaseibacillus paracasei]|uniref:DUF1642 domain-containing protein n=1 Tax=Lacticaseibacillus paracasei TaxID=1597 RepID=UPI002A5A35FC|nr:DUF1642 domain-containing protein [Lacticaseibacillus paracasei]MDY0837399.1 DUF1642 domain-containing protein [Lacticaseibacillus paracasei]
MSEEKLYAVKNDEGKYWDFSGKVTGFWARSEVEVPATDDKDLASALAMDCGDCVVTLIEEPKKVVVSPEEAKLVKNCLWTNLQDAFLNNINLLFRGRRPEDVTRLKSALTNGYTVAKEKKYKVRVPETQTSYYYKGSDGHVHASDTSGGLDNEFSDYELQQYGLDGERFTKEEVTDDGE